MTSRRFKTRCRSAPNPASSGRAASRISAKRVSRATNALGSARSHAPSTSERVAAATVAPIAPHIAMTAASATVRVGLTITKHATKIPAAAPTAVSCSRNSSSSGAK
jgi:hypothetical protein